MNYDHKRALALLRAGANQPDARFREGQEEAVRHIVEGRGRLLVVQKTGWGKSFVYFIAVKLLREGGLGPALLVSPLLALMRNQIAAAQRMGVRAATINSDNQDDWEKVEADIHAGGVDILLVSPERLANEHFRSEVLARVAGQISLLVIDEAHCISDWGHDFRPQYRLLERIVRTLPRAMRLLATTATANNRVMEDLREVLGPDLAVSKGDLNRPSLLLQTMKMPGQAERLAWLAGILPFLQGSGIIYTLTVHDAEEVADWLKSRGFNVEAYAGETGERRPELEQALLDNRVKALVATTALGMGFDKPDLSFVIHYQAPGSAVAYYQQVGRAGRALDGAYGVLLGGIEDDEIIDYFIGDAFPTREEAGEVLGALAKSADGLSINGLAARLNIRYGRIVKTLELLSLESPAPVVREKSKWMLTSAPLSAEFWARADRLTMLRREERRQMREYGELKTGHMEYLIRLLDGEPGETTPPPIPPLGRTVDPALLRGALAFLRRLNRPFNPRERWPSGGLPKYGVQGLIPVEHRAEPGMALCCWGDAGWGELIRRGKYEDGAYDDELVAAAAEMFGRWNPEPAPEWVACVPSRRHPELVRGFAERLAARVGLPFYPVLEKTLDSPAQKIMANSFQQARNVDGVFAVREGGVPNLPVLLVDDMVDSGWTMTVAAWLLRTNGAGEVFPMALARSGNRK